jgi:glutamate-1-semialdehyde 2,1-aminomutase
MGAMNQFLRWAGRPETARCFEETNQRCADWAQSTNQALYSAGLPLRIAHLGTVWTVLFREPSRYNWLLQYYFRAEGLALSWVGTGRCLISMDFAPNDFADLQDSIVNAAQKMKLDGWWLTQEQHPKREREMKSRLIREMLGSLVPMPRPLRLFCAEVMQRKHDDHHASHSNPINQWLHLVSSSLFVYCYALALFDLTTAMYLGLFSLFIRQFGHAILEPPCHDKEALLLGFNTRNKTLIFLGYLLVPITHMARDGGWTIAVFSSMIPAIAWQWFLWTLLVVGGRVVFLVWKHNFRNSMLWLVKLVTDPVTDIAAYFPRRLLGTAK